VLPPNLKNPIFLTRYRVFAFMGPSPRFANTNSGGITTKFKKTIFLTRYRVFAFMGPVPGSQIQILAVLPLRLRAHKFALTLIHSLSAYSQHNIVLIIYDLSMRHTDSLEQMDTHATVFEYFPCLDPFRWFACCYFVGRGSPMAQPLSYPHLRFAMMPAAPFMIG